MNDALKREALSKGPQVTLTFWIIKIAATTLGETGGDDDAQLGLSRSIGKIGHHSAEGRRGDDRRPVEQRMKPLSENLRCGQANKKADENRGTDVSAPGEAAARIYEPLQRVQARLL
jgi:hypothetical protein